MSSISSGLMTISWFNVICPGIFPVVPMYITAEFLLCRHSEFIRLNSQTFFFEDGTELPRISLSIFKFYWRKRYSFVYVHFAAVLILVTMCYDLFSLRARGEDTLGISGWGCGPCSSLAYSKS